MKVGISTASLFCRQYTEEAVETFREWGVPCTEVFFSTYSEYEPSFAKLVAERKGGMQVNSVHVLNTQFEPQLYNANDRCLKDAYFWLGKTMESAKLLGSRHYTFHGIARLKRSFKENFERVGNMTKDAFDFCKQYGVTLCFENVEWAFYNRPGVFTELKKRCPDLKGVLDVKQARISGYGYEQYLEEMGNDLAYVHVSDVDENGKMRLPGQGTFDYDEMIKRLRDVGFDGALIIENYQNDYSELDELKRSFEFLSEKI